MLHRFYRDSGSPRAVVHEGQLAEGPLVVVCEQPLFRSPFCLGGFEHASLYDVEVVTLLSLPASQHTAAFPQVGCKKAALEQQYIPLGCTTARAGQKYAGRLTPSLAALWSATHRSALAFQIHQHTL